MFANSKGTQYCNPVHGGWLRRSCCSCFPGYSKGSSAAMDVLSLPGGCPLWISTGWGTEKGRLTMLVSAVALQYSVLIWPRASWLLYRFYNRYRKFVCVFLQCSSLIWVTAVSIIVSMSLITVIEPDETQWVTSSSQFRSSSSCRRLLCSKQWGFQRFPASLRDRTHLLSGNPSPLVFSLKFLFASSILCQLPLWSTLSKSINIYIFKIIWHN